MADSAEVGDATPLNLSVLSSFPKSPEDFDADPRVSFSKVSNKFILETDDGEEFEYDDALKRWIPAVRFYPTRGSIEESHVVICFLPNGFF